MSGRPDYLPKDSLEKLKVAKELLSSIDDLKRLNIDSMVDSEIEDRRFVGEIEKDVSNIAENSESKASILQQEIISDIEQDFKSNLQLYVFMVENKLEEDYFPFYEWIRYMSEVENKNDVKLNVGHREIFTAFSEIAKVDESLAKGNLSYYLCKSADYIKNHNSFFPDLLQLIKAICPNASVIDALCGKETYEIHKGLVGNHVPLTEESKLIYSYAVSIPNSSWQFKSKKIGDIQVKHSTSDYEEIYAEFAKGEIWNRIKDNPKFKKRFVEEIFKANLKEHPFYEESGYGWTKTIKEIKWDNMKAFVNNLSKDDTELAQLIVDKVLSRLTKDKREFYNAQAMQVVNLALKAELQKDLPIIEIKEKKMKI